MIQIIASIADHTTISNESISLEHCSEPSGKYSFLASSPDIPKVSPGVANVMVKIALLVGA